MYIFYSLAAVAALAAASPQGIPSSIPPVSKAPNFRITAAFAQDSPLSEVAGGWNLTSYHITPCYDYAVFTNHTGRTFYANGTDEQFANHTSNLLSDGGTPPWPWGTVVAAANATDDEGRRPVYINCGQGTPGFQVADWPGTVYYGTGTFYVCNATLLYGPAIALYWRKKVDQTPEGCANVELQAWCLDDDTEHELQRNSTCYGTTPYPPRLR
ncbi:hypothetical protein BU26DRAFT_560875 [Trematosphaeria pertusa]|uniref:DUF7907 domain-containing protein n=1 Tax=Trematosphaeria pertusa TaxID=390896 RepID=A0A6A6ISW1_9PLEO|nr:uncharacterized protein BU26DRAFT_560875 [Trematosphaeria pertusa]KAF2253584.1 hypothetical protein BU26DRAFT_560875 [Trematosphaeria pertusa]